MDLYLHMRHVRFSIAEIYFLFSLSEQTLQFKWWQVSRYDEHQFYWPLSVNVGDEVFFFLMYLIIQSFFLSIYFQNLLHTQEKFLC